MHFILPTRSSRALSYVLLVSAAICCAGAARAEVRISDGKSRHMSCSAGICTPKAAQAILNVTDLANMLAAGDVTVKSDSAALDIRFAAPISWTSTHRLTLDSYHSITFKSPVTVAGTGALTITTNDGGAGGNYSFDGEGHVEFWDLNSSLIVGGRRFKLANTLAQLADGASKKRGTGYVALAKSYDALDDGTYKKPLVKQFSGTMEGLGNHLKNFSLKFRKVTEYYHLVGLIGRIGFPGLVQNLTLENANISCAIADDFVGALAGQNYGTIRSVSVTGIVKGFGNPNVVDNVGGLVGRNFGSVINSHSDATVEDGAWVGGLVGFLLSQDSLATVVNSSATGAVSSYYTTGGLVGGAGSTTESITYSFATGDVDNLPKPPSLNGHIGGLLGNGSAQIIASHAEGRVTGSDGTTAGGLVAGPGGTVDRSFSTGDVTVEGECDACGGLTGTGAISIANSYSLSGVTAKSCDACGGLVGGNGGIISASYSTGLVNPSSGFAIGGLIGSDLSNTGSLSDLYWDLDTSGISDPSQGAGNKANDPGITGVSDNALKSNLPNGFDPKIWTQKKNINNGYPYLLANPPQ
jgi:hypothetical protein